MSDNTAILAGFTKELLAEGGTYSLHIFVKPDTDLDDRFRAYDADECEWINVNGWLFSFEEVEDYTECPSCGDGDNLYGRHNRTECDRCGWHS